MGIRKYIKDYRKEYIVKPNGKPGVTASYIGKYYRFAAGEPAIKRARCVFACLSALATVCCVIPFFYNASGSHTIYVALPHVISLFPLAHLILGVYSLYTCKPPLIREFRDKTEGRITASSAAAMCCLGVTAIGQILSCALSGWGVLDVISLALIAAACGAVGYIFFSRKVLKTVECNKNGTEE